MKLPFDDMFIPRWPSLHTGLCHVPACQNVSQNIQSNEEAMKSNEQVMFFCLLQLSRHYQPVFMHMSTMCVLMHVHQRMWRRSPDDGTGKKLNCFSFPPLAGDFSAGQLVNFSTATWKLLPHISKRGICLNFANLNNLTCLTGLWKIHVNFK